MLDEAGVELAKVSKCDTQTRSLRDRFESDFDLYRNEKFEIPSTEGKWESYTSNRANSDANKLINTLASARLKISIPIRDEAERERLNLSRTEQFVYGVLALRDSIYQTIPEAGLLQGDMSALAPLRGWLAICCYLYEENKKVKPHIPVWDILNTYWISGYDGLLWTCYKRWASPEEIKSQYNIDLSPDAQGRVIIHDVWDRDEYGTIGGGEYLNKKKHGLNHIPVLILHGGSVPLIQSGEHDDTISNVGESWAVNNRNLYETESRVGSYLQTLTGLSAKAPIKAYYDSTRGGKPIEYSSDPSQKAGVIDIDIGKGQELKEGTSPEMTRDAYAFFEHLQGRLSIGGMAPVSYGQINQALPAAGINLLRHASMENINTFQLLIERVYTWLAHEIVSQYKNSDFGGMTVQGIDGSNRLFRMEVKPEDINEEWNFKVELNANLPQDEMANVGMAVQSVESRLLSRQTARDRYSLVDDTDLEQKTIDREEAYNITNIKLRREAAALIADGDVEGAQYILDAIQEMQMQQRPGVASQPGIPSAVRPSGTTTAATPQPPQASGFRRWLSRMGGSQQ